MGSHWSYSYWQVLRYCFAELRESIRKKRPDVWRNNSWILHHYNVPAHTSFVVKEFLAKNMITVFEHPPYSPDLDPCDFFLFDRSKNPMRGDYLGSIANIKTESARVLNLIPKSDFQKCFQSWKSRWQKCLAAQGE